MCNTLEADLVFLMFVEEKCFIHIVVFGYFQP